MPDEGSAQPAAAVPAAQTTKPDNKTPATVDTKADDTSAISAESKVEEATPTEEPAESEPVPKAAKEDEEAAKPADGKPSFLYLTPSSYNSLITCLLTIVPFTRLCRETC